MSAKIEELTHKENELYKYWGGHIPEANTELNNLQRDKINAVFMENGAAYIGKINFYDNERENLAPGNVFNAYTGEKVYNFGADFVIPVIDNALAEMIVEWNRGLPTSLSLINKITNRISELGGANLIWT